MAHSCPVRSTSAAELSRRGWELTRDGDAQTGLACHRAATALADANAYTWFHRGQSEVQLALDGDARTSFEKATRGGQSPVLEPQAATEAHFQLGRLARENGALKLAESSYVRAIELQPTAPGAHIMLGVTLRDAGRLSEALARYTSGLRIQPAIPAAQYNRAQCLLQLARRSEALAGFETAVALDPTFAVAYSAIGDELTVQGRHADALRAFDAVVALEPSSGTAHYNVGKVHFTMRQLPQALAAHGRALSLPETSGAPHAYVHNDLGNALSDVSGRQAEVLYHYSRAAQLMPGFAEALSNVGTGLKEVGRHAEAARSFERAIRAKPTLCEAYKNLGTSYGEIDGRLPEAVNAFEGALRINGQFWPALYALLDTKQFLADWRDRPELMRTLGTHLHELHTSRRVGTGPDERMHGGLAPFQTLVMDIPVPTQLAVTRNRARKDIDMAHATPLEPPLRWTGRAAPSAVLSTAAPPPLPLPLRVPADRRLRLGLLSADFGDHPVGHALLPWVRALRRRPRLDVLCFASDSLEKGHVGSESRRALAAACSAFYDVTSLSDAEAARAINEQRPHVLINLVGHTAGSRHVVTQWRPAPVQAMHYGYPATSALPAMEYIQLDAVAAPPSLRSDFTERLAYFPYCHFVAVHAQRYPHAAAAAAGAHPWSASRVVVAEDGGLVSRADLGLGRLGSRDSALALCNFNQLYKMDASTLHVWGNALRRLPRAFLWLTRVSVRKDTSLYAQGNILGEAAALGVRAERLAFTFRFPQADYVAFRALADLMLDNRAYNAHTTGADTLWAGVPAVLTATRHLAGRASAAFAAALGSAQMVAPSLRAYEDAVDALGHHPARLWAMRRHLLRVRDEAPFFDLPRLAQGQHRLANAMWAVFGSGHQPMHIVAAR